MKHLECLKLSDKVFNSVLTSRISWRGTDNNKGGGNNNKARNNSLERIWKLKFNE